MSKKMSKLVANRRKGGQNTAEYLIMLVLISVGSIGVFSVFGGTLRNQVSSAVSAFGGQSSDYEAASKRAQSGSKQADKMSNEALNMSGVKKSDIDGFDQNAKEE